MMVAEFCTKSRRQSRPCGNCPVRCRPPGKNNAKRGTSPRFRHRRLHMKTNSLPGVSGLGISRTSDIRAAVRAASRIATRRRRPHSIDVPAELLVAALAVARDGDVVGLVHFEPDRAAAAPPRRPLGRQQQPLRRPSRSSPARPRSNRAAPPPNLIETARSLCRPAPPPPRRSIARSAIAGDAAGCGAKAGR